MIGLLSLKLFNSIFIKTEENNNFELYKFPDSKIGGLSNEKFREEIEKDLENSDNTAIHFQVEIIGPRVIDEYRDKITKRMQGDKY